MTSKQDLRNYILEMITGQYNPEIAGKMIKIHLEFTYKLYRAVLDTLNNFQKQDKKIIENFKKEIKSLIVSNLDINNETALNNLVARYEKLGLKYSVGGMTESFLSKVITTKNLILGVGALLGALAAIGVAWKHIKSTGNTISYNKDFEVTLVEVSKIYDSKLKAMLLKTLDDILNFKIKSDGQLKYKFYEDVEKLLISKPSLKGSLQDWVISI